MLLLNFEEFFSVTPSTLIQLDTIFIAMYRSYIIQVNLFAKKENLPNIKNLQVREAPQNNYHFNSRSLAPCH